MSRVGSTRCHTNDSSSSRICAASAAPPPPPPLVASCFISRSRVVLIVVLLDDVLKLLLLLLDAGMRCRSCCEDAALGSFIHGDLSKRGSMLGAEQGLRWRECLEISFFLIFLLSVTHSGF